MASTQSYDAILFDLDDTLFDRLRSIRRGAAALQRQLPGLTHFDPEFLLVRLIAVFQAVHYKTQREGTTPEERKTMNAELLCHALGLKKPRQRWINLFHITFREAYAENWKATRGSIETLERLRESGKFKVMILANGEQSKLVEKADAIGVRILTSGVISSELAGHPKPDSRAYKYAADELGVPAHRTLMVSDTFGDDIEGALDVGMGAVWYNPAAKGRERVSEDGTRVPIISKMTQLLTYLGIDEEN